MSPAAQRRGLRSDDGRIAADRPDELDNTGAPPYYLR